MVSPVLLQKEHMDLPDHYGMEIKYVTGNTDKLTIAGHRLIDKVYEKGVLSGVMSVPFFEIWTKDNEMVVLPLSSVISIKFDKNWSKIIDIKDKLQKEQK